jgi:uncharacterized integral membrane protein
MRATVVWLVLILLAATIFALSNTNPVTVAFWQWPIYTGPLALVIVGAGVLGALLTLLPSLARQSHLGWRIRDLERRLQVHETDRMPTPAGSPPPPSRPSVLEQPTTRVEDTRRFT